jgi:hypothetical protein
MKINDILLSETTPSCKRRKRLAKEFRHESQTPNKAFKYMKGRWKPEEMALLMRVADLCVYEGLSAICDICFEVGLQRPRRAIDKQLKRSLKYVTWQERDIKDVRAKIAMFLQDSFAYLTIEQSVMIDQCHKAYIAKTIASQSLLKHPKNRHINSKLYSGKF